MSVSCIPVDGAYLEIGAVVSVRSYKRVCVCSGTVNDLGEKENVQLFCLVPGTAAYVILAYE